MFKFLIGYSYDYKRPILGAENCYTLIPNEIDSEIIEISEPDYENFDEWTKKVFEEIHARTGREAKKVISIYKLGEV